MYKEKEDFANVIFADENSVEMNAHGKMFFHHSEEGIEMKTRKRSKPKHAYKVHNKYLKIFEVNLFSNNRSIFMQHV